MTYKVALVLGGGGSRGLAHLGVINVLQRENIPIDLIIGTSMGAIIGSLYAHGLSHLEITQTLARIETNRIGPRTLLSADTRQKTLENLLAPYLRDVNFDDLNPPMRIMAVNLLDGAEVCLSEGPVLPAIMASSAIPAVFPPVAHQNMLLADGGILDNLATWPAFQSGAQCVIAVDVYPSLSDEDPWADPLNATMGYSLPLTGVAGVGTPNAVSSLWRSFRILACHVHDERLKAHPPHILLRPEISKLASMDFSNIYSVIEAGRRAAEEQLDQIRALTQPNN